MENIKFDNNLLEEYKIFEDANKGNWNILSYLNFKFDLNAAVAFSKFFMPDFIERDGCAILEFLYKEAIFNEWSVELNGAKSEIERMCNLYEVKDYFTLNSYSEDEIQTSQIEYLGYTLKILWQLLLDKLYNEKKYNVVTFYEHESLFITFFQS